MFDLYLLGLIGQNITIALAALCRWYFVDGLMGEMSIQLRYIRRTFTK